MEYFFLIGDNTDMSIIKHEEVRYTSTWEDAEEYTVYRHGMFFDENKALGDFFDDFLIEWGEIREFCKGKDIGTTIYNFLVSAARPAINIITPHLKLEYSGFTILPRRILPADCFQWYRFNPVPKEDILHIIK